MATKTQSRKRATNTFGISKFRSTVTAIACTVTLSAITPSVHAVAQDQPSAIAQLDKVLSSSNPEIAELARAIAKAQSEVAQLEASIGQHREAVNRALVDLQDARTEAAQARDGAKNAKSDLGDAQSEVEKAQKRLNEISRTAYRRANTSEAVTNAAGGDARSAMLERQAYLRGQAEEQQSVVDKLEKVRTEKANKESQLRLAQELAEAREVRASEAEASARQVLEESESQIVDIAAERESLIKQEQQAQALLNEARGIDEESQPAGEQGSAGEGAARPSASQAPARDERAGGDEAAAPSRAASEETSEAASVADAAPAPAPAPVSAPASEDAAEVEEVRTQVADEVTTGTGQADEAPAPAQSSEDSVSPEDLARLAELSSQGDSAAPASDAQGSSVANIDVDNALAFAGTAAGAAAAIIALTQPEHAALANDAAAALNNLTPALQGPGTTDEADQELAGQLDDVLPSVATSNDVTETAQEAVADLDRQSKVDAVISRARSQIGTPYAWGGGNANGPTQGIRDGGVADRHGDYNKVGFDCSGLTLYAFAGAGISLQHFTGYQYNQGTKVAISDIEPGDLLFWGPSGNQHVAIYTGNGMMIEAPQSGQVVSEVPVRYAGMAPNAVRLI